MIERFAAMPIAKVRKILKSNMANQDGRDGATKKNARIVKTGFRRSTFKQIADGVLVAIPLIFDGASNAKIYKTTRRETGRPLDCAIIRRLREGCYTHRDRVWRLDFVTKTFTGPGSDLEQIELVQTSPPDDASEIATVSLILKRCMSDLAACGLSDLRIDEDGKIRATRSTTVIIDLPKA